MIRKIFHYLITLLKYWYYSRPSRKLIVIGVTGTKGKSTTCSFISSVLRAGGKKVCVLSTVEFRIGEKRELNKKKMTMLGRGQIHRFLAEAVNTGCEYAVIETSSEGILQYRHKFLNYDIGVFTNLGTEHQERHGGFENLKRDKGKMFAEIGKHKKRINGKKVKKVIIVNGDDENVDYYLSFKSDKKYIFGLGNLERYLEKKYEIFLAENIGDREGGNSFYVRGLKISPKILGDFNIYNCLASYCVGKSQNIPEEQIKKGIEDVKQVEGRMEFIDEGQNFKVAVDYAHEPMSLKELFTSLRSMLRSNNKHTPNPSSQSIGTQQENNSLLEEGKGGVGGRLIAIIGSDGGGRDKGKREKMGKIAGKFCDLVIVTDVNCYDEDPKSIAEMLAKGAREAGKKDGQDLLVEVERRKAIEIAFKRAQAGDIVAITAKGTEPYIAVANGEKHPWDDRVVSREILQGLKTKN